MLYMVLGRWRKLRGCAAIVSKVCVWREGGQGGCWFEYFLIIALGYSLCFFVKLEIVLKYLFMVCDFEFGNCLGERLDCWFHICMCLMF